MITIPKQLQITGARFGLVKKNEKTACEKKWQSVNNYSHEDTKLLAHIANGGNYFFLCESAGIITLDSDTKHPEAFKELREVIEKKLPQTFEVETGSGGTHDYYRCPIKQKIILETDKHYGELQAKGQYVVGPGCHHPNGNDYRIVKDLPIAEVSEEKMLEVLKPFMEEVKSAEDRACNEIKKYNDYGASDINSLNITSVINTSGFKQMPNGELAGPNPWHGSTTGINTWINPSKNVAHCFRHHCGINVAQAIGMNEGIIKREDEYIDKNTFIKILKVAQEKYGLKKPEKPVEQQQSETSSAELLTYKDFEHIKKNRNYIVEDLFYPGEVNMTFSPPKQFKSIFVLGAAMAIATGRKFMGHKSRKGAVLYLDGENNNQIIRKRLLGLRRGFGIRSKRFPLYFLKSFIIMDNKKNIHLGNTAMLEKHIEEKKIKIMFIDTLHRFAFYDENKADDLNLLYMNFFKPLVEKYNICIVFLCHTNKDGQYRGSSDLMGQVDRAYRMIRMNMGDKFRFINEVSRSGEIPDINGEITFGKEESDKKFYIQINNTLSVEQDSGGKKFREVLGKVKEFLLEKTEADRFKLGDIKDHFEATGYEFNKNMVIKVLNWMFKTARMLDKDEKGNYNKLT